MSRGRRADAGAGARAKATGPKSKGEGQGRTGRRALTFTEEPRSVLGSLLALRSRLRHIPAGRLHAWLVGQRRDNELFILGALAPCLGRIADARGLLPMHLPPRPKSLFEPAASALGRRCAARRVARRTAWILAEWMVTFHNLYETGLPKAPASYRRRIRPYAVTPRQKAAFMMLVEDVLPFCRPRAELVWLADAARHDCMPHCANSTEEMRSGEPP